MSDPKIEVGGPMTPTKLRLIADWMDTNDRLAEAFAEQQGATYVAGDEVQADLRRWAEELEQRTMTADEWASTLGEGIHAGFRKGSDHAEARKYYRTIVEMPDELWNEVMRYCVGGLALVGLIEVQP